MSAIGSEILWPLGLSQRFLYGKDTLSSDFADEHGARDFYINPLAETFMFQELLAQGATRYRMLHPQNQIGHSGPLKSLIRVADKDGDIAERTRRLLTPIATAFGLDGQLLEPIENLMYSESAMYIFTLPEPERPTWSAMCIIFNSVYELLLGLRYKTQIDIPVRLTSVHLRRLLDRCDSPRAGYVLASLLGVLNSYREVSMSSPVVRSAYLSSASADWVESFREFVENVEYQQYVEARAGLGFVDRQRAAISRVSVIARRVVRSGEFRAVFKVGQKVTKVMTSLPIDAVEMDPLFRQDQYLPPVVSLRDAVERATSRWEKLAGDDGAHVSMTQEGFKWFSNRYSVPQATVTLSLDSPALSLIDASTDSKTPSDIPGVSRGGVMTMLERRRSQAIGERPFWCEEHDATIIAKHVNIALGEKTIDFRVECCCLEAAKGAVRAVMTGESQKVPGE